MKMPDVAAGFPAKAALTLLLASLPLSAMADADYFLSLRAGHDELKFSPEYHFTTGRAPARFDNRKEGFIGSVGAGYRMPLAESFSLDLGADLIYQEAQWTLSLPAEPSDFRYEIPFTFGIRLAPAWEPAPRWRLFAELGLVYGQVKERKRSPVASNYDISDWTAGTLVGAGIGYRLSDRLGLTLSLGRIRYREVSYNSYLPNGTHRETIHDKPESDYASIGFEYGF